MADQGLIDGLVSKRQVMLTGFSGWKIALSQCRKILNLTITTSEFPALCHPRGSKEKLAARALRTHLPHPPIPSITVMILGKYILKL